MVIRQTLPLAFPVSTEPRAARAMAIAVTVAVHAVIGAWIVNSAFHPFAPPDISDDPPMTIENFPKESPKLTIQAPTSTAHVVVHHSETIIGLPPATLPDDTIRHTIGVDTHSLATNLGDTGIASVGVESKTTTITNPDWLRRPSAEQVADAYPERAQRMEVSGLATLSCKVAATGAVADCAIVAETPTGFAFGKAALGLTRYFRLKPRTEDGHAIDGAVVRIPTRFTISKP